MLVAKVRVLISPVVILATYPNLSVGQAVPSLGMCDMSDGAGPPNSKGLQIYRTYI